MRLLVIGIDRGSPEFLFEDIRLSNIRHLMNFGSFGVLEGAAQLPQGLEWLCLATSKERVDVELPAGATIWEQIERQGKHVIVIRVPPGISYPQKTIEAINEGLEGEPATEMADQPVLFEVIKERVYAQSLGQFDQVRQLMRSEPWDYFQFVDMGLEHLYRANRTGSAKPDRETIREYYLYLDEQVGAILEMLDEDTTVLILSPPSDSAKVGCFVLASAALPVSGVAESVNLLDIAPTLLELGGYEIPAAMQGKSMVAGHVLGTEADKSLSYEEEEILRERLSGLGYV